MPRLAWLSRVHSAVAGWMRRGARRPPLAGLPPPGVSGQALAAVAVTLVGLLGVAARHVRRSGRDPPVEALPVGVDRR